MKKLLGGAAIAALLTGAAQAQVTNVPTAGSAANLPARDAAFVAAEFQPALAANQLAGTVIIQSSFGDDAPFEALPVDGRVRLTIELVNATFTSATGASFTGNDLGACAFETAAVAGGGVGGTSVQFISTAAAGISTCDSSVGESAGGAADGGSIGAFSIPLRRVNSSDPVGVRFIYRQVNADGSAVANPVEDIQTVNFADTAVSWNATTAAHGIVAGAELLASSNGILASGSLGSISTDFRTTAPDSDDVAIDIRNAAGTGLDIENLLGGDNELRINFPGGRGDITNVALGGDDCGAPTGNLFTCELSAAAVAGLSTTAITYTVGGGAEAPATPEQFPTAELVLDPNANWVLAGFGPSNLAEIRHDTGRRLTTVNGAFEWNRLGAGFPQSLFRISAGTSARAEAIEQVVVTFAAGNTTTGGSVTLNPSTNAATGFQITGANITFNSRSLAAAIEDADLYLPDQQGGAVDITSVQVRHVESVLTVPQAGDLVLQRQLVSRNDRITVPGANSN